MSKNLFVEGKFVKSKLRFFIEKEKMNYVENSTIKFNSKLPKDIQQELHDCNIEIINPFAKYSNQMKDNYQSNIKDVLNFFDDNEENSLEHKNSSVLNIGELLMTKKMTISRKKLQKDSERLNTSIRGNSSIDT